MVRHGERGEQRQGQRHRARQRRAPCRCLRLRHQDACHERDGQGLIGELRVEHHVDGAAHVGEAADTGQAGRSCNPLEEREQRRDENGAADRDHYGASGEDGKPGQVDQRRSHQFEARIERGDEQQIVGHEQAMCGQYVVRRAPVQEFIELHEAGRIREHFEREGSLGQDQQEPDPLAAGHLRRGDADGDREEQQSHAEPEHLVSMRGRPRHQARQHDAQRGVQAQTEQPIEAYARRVGRATDRFWRDKAHDKSDRCDRAAPKLSDARTAITRCEASAAHGERSRLHRSAAADMRNRPRSVDRLPAA